MEFRLKFDVEDSTQWRVEWMVQRARIDGTDDVDDEEWRRDIEWKGMVEKVGDVEEENRNSHSLGLGDLVHLNQTGSIASSIEISGS